MITDLLGLFGPARVRSLTPSESYCLTFSVRCVPPLYIVFYSCILTKDQCLSVVARRPRTKLMRSRVFPGLIMVISSWAHARPSDELIREQVCPTLCRRQYRFDNKVKCVRFTVYMVQVVLLPETFVPSSESGIILVELRGERDSALLCSWASSVLILLSLLHEMQLVIPPPLNSCHILLHSRKPSSPDSSRFRDQNPSCIRNFIPRNPTSDVASTQIGCKRSYSRQDPHEGEVVACHSTIRPSALAKLIQNCKLFCVRYITQ